MKRALVMSCAAIACADSVDLVPPDDVERVIVIATRTASGAIEARHVVYELPRFAAPWIQVRFSSTWSNSARELSRSAARVSISGTARTRSARRRT